MHENSTAADKNVLSGAEGLRELNDHVLILPAQGNALAVRTDIGLVLVDSGPGRGATARMIKALRDWCDDPVHAICYSHGHVGYNDGVADWMAHAAERGEPKPRLIAQENAVRRYNRYRETAGLQGTLNSMQFPQLKLAPAGEKLVNPTVTFRERMVLACSPPIELISAPSETDDVMSLWLPEDGILYAGAAFPGTTIANVGTPLRSLRLTIRWAETLEMLAGLNATTLIQEFGRIVEGAENVRHRLLTTAKALRWMRREVVVRMNRGMTDVEIMHDIDYPDELFDHGFMRERYGARDYIVRDIYREENGWWTDRNATNLHPAHPDEAAAAVLSAITDRKAVLDRARALADEGKSQQALHVVDLLALAPGDEPELVEARNLKADICRKRAEEIAPYVSKALYSSTATLLEGGRRRWSEPAPD
ncbi:MAG: hypothetical protein TEF_12860 [Rhizobiales bacterium NRL2]|jgi:uncharacterized sulfatase|nr:MAG: hypothetical protein TEF_12860 [Rhizobiales bacterium NRL2]